MGNCDVSGHKAAPKRGKSLGSSINLAPTRNALVGGNTAVGHGIETTLDHIMHTGDPRTLAMRRANPKPAHIIAQMNTRRTTLRSRLGNLGTPPRRYLVSVTAPRPCHLGPAITGNVKATDLSAGQTAENATAPLTGGERLQSFGCVTK